MYVTLKQHVDADDLNKFKLKEGIDCSQIGYFTTPNGTLVLYFDADLHCVDDHEDLRKALLSPVVDKNDILAIQAEIGGDEIRQAYTHDGYSQAVTVNFDAAGEVIAPRPELSSSEDAYAFWQDLDSAAPPPNSAELHAGSAWDDEWGASPPQNPDDPFAQHEDDFGFGTHDTHNSGFPTSGFSDWHNPHDPMNELGGGGGGYHNPFTSRGDHSLADSMERRRQQIQRQNEQLMRLMAAEQERIRRQNEMMLKREEAAQRARIEAVNRRIIRETTQQWDTQVQNRMQIVASNVRAQGVFWFSTLPDNITWLKQNNEAGASAVTTATTPGVELFQEPPLANFPSLDVLLAKYKTDNSEAALRRAAHQNNAEDITALVKTHGVNINAQDGDPQNSEDRAEKKCWTALHWAYRRNNTEVIEELTALGASDEILDAKGKKPSDYARAPVSTLS